MTIGLTVENDAPLLASRNTYHPLTHAVTVGSCEGA